MFRLPFLCNMLHDLGEHLPDGWGGNRRDGAPNIYYGAGTGRERPRLGSYPSRQVHGVTVVNGLWPQRVDATPWPGNTGWDGLEVL